MDENKNFTLKFSGGWGQKAVNDWIAMQSSLETAKKTKTNPHFKSTYADLEEVFRVGKAALLAHGFAFCQAVSASDNVVMITTQIWHKSGEWICSMLEIKARDASAANIGAAATYGRRFGFSAMVGIASEDDDDGASQIQQNQGGNQRRDNRQQQNQGGKNVSRETKPAQIFDMKNNSHIDKMEAWLKKSSMPPDLYDDFMLHMNGRDINSIGKIATEFLKGKS